MTKGRIFLLAEGDELREMIEETYVSEADLQRLLARYPNLLPGDQMNEESPRRWLLVSREVAVPDREEGAGRWSLDHLFLDQDGVPTLVEVKRSSDTRIRREVLLERLNQVPGVRLPPDSHNRAPNFPFAVLANDASWVAFEGVLRWYLAQIGAEPATAAGSGEAEGSTSIRAARGMLRGIDTTVERDDDRV